MPELPEVETIRRQIEPDLTGRRIEAVEILDPYFTKPAAPSSFESAVEGMEIAGVSRRGKYLLLDLADGRSIVIHLRMTGNLLLIDPEGVENPGDARIYEPSAGEKHLKARFTLDDGGEIRFTDPRRFGRGFVADQRTLDEYFGARLGVEPLSSEFTPEVMARIASNRKVPLKSFLLNQAGVVGIGNIYADEALFRARLHPLSPAGSMRPEHAGALRDAIVESLERGLDLGGASIDDYRDAKGEAGSMQNEFLVHRREGEPCACCGTAIIRIIVGGRSTYFCPECQVRLRKKPTRRKAAPKASA